MKLRNKKTGEIINAGDTFELASYAENGMSLRERHEYKSLSELCEDWEDCKPTEPLIKDERIRKAIKVWARLNVVREVMFDEYWHSFRDMDMVISFLFTFRDFDCLEDGKTYTIAELCGEEEE